MANATVEIIRLNEEIERLMAAISNLSIAAERVGNLFADQHEGEAFDWLSLKIEEAQKLLGIDEQNETEPE